MLKAEGDGISFDLLSTFSESSKNQHSFPWTIVEGDNIDSKAIATNARFVLVISDPSGDYANVTTEQYGYENGSLWSRAFILEDAAQTSVTASATSTTTLSTFTESTTSSTLLPSCLRSLYSS